MTQVIVNIKKSYFYICNRIIYIIDNYSFMSLNFFTIFFFGINHLVVFCNNVFETPRCSCALSLLT